MMTPSILVVGSINLDLILRCARLPNAGEALIGERYDHIPGGKGANQAVAAARLGARVSFVGRTGSDANGRLLRARLAPEGVDLSLLSEDPDHPTGLAVVIVETDGTNRILVYTGANEHVPVSDIERALTRRFDGVIANLEIGNEAIYALGSRCEALGLPFVLDAGPARGFDFARLRGLTVLSPNESEASFVAGVPCSTDDEACACARLLLDRTGARLVLLKLGARGSLLLGDSACELVPPFPVRAVDPTAAGDAFTAAFLVRYLERGGLRDAALFANAAGALACLVTGAQPSLPRRAAVEELLATRGKGGAIRSL